MAQEATSSQRSASPVNSRRGSPGSHRRTKNKDDYGIVKQDKHVRNYASRVKGVLSLFDTALEGWADYISFLSRLLKVLQTKPAGYAEIPHSALVAKRLSQCLNPVLPSGVHSKALEVYGCIFEVLGESGLSRDLSLYLPGLTPVLSFASLSVKPTLLGLFETYLLALNLKTLRPALKSIILALLPGLEEESSEEFERTLCVLDGFKEIANHHQAINFEQTNSLWPQYFWSCIFLTTITSNTRRAGALSYLTRRLPLLGWTTITQPSAQAYGSDGIEGDGQHSLEQAIELVASPEPGLLIRCFCAGLHDRQILIQRGFLDLLVTNLPLHSPVLQEKAVPGDLKRLISAASSVVARREMSLNRRLWAWFLGPEPGTDAANGLVPRTNPPASVALFSPSLDSGRCQLHYFEAYGLNTLVDSLDQMISTVSDNPSTLVRPLRICQSLMDRWEISVLVTPRVFLPILKSVFQYQSLKVSREAKIEVLKSANMFFDGVESVLIWAELCKVIEKALDPETVTTEERCELLKFLQFVAGKFNVREEEMLVLHVPLVSLVLLLRIDIFQRMSKLSLRKDCSEVIICALGVLHKLVDLVPPRAFAGTPSSDELGKLKKKYGTLHVAQLLTNIGHFYQHAHGDDLTTKEPLSQWAVGQELLSGGLALVARMLVSGPSTAAEADVMISVLGLLIHKVPLEDVPPAFDDVQTSLLHRAYQNPDNNISAVPFPVVAAKVLTLENLYAFPISKSWIDNRTMQKLIPLLLTDLWPYLSPAKLKHNVEAVRVVWRLSPIASDPHLIESTIATLMAAKVFCTKNLLVSLEGVQSFVTLWTHSPVTSKSSHSRRSSTVQPGSEATSQDTIPVEMSLLEKPLMLVLDILADPGAELFTFVGHWLTSLQSLDLIVSTLVNRLSRTPCVATNLSMSSRGVEKEDREFSDEDSNDWQLCLYYTDSLLHVLQYAPEHAWPAIESLVVVRDTPEVGTRKQLFLIDVCLELLTYRDENEDGHYNDLTRLKQSVLSLLGQLLRGPLSDEIGEMEIERSLLEELELSVEFSEYSLQVTFMEIALVALKLRCSRNRYGTTWKSQRSVSKSPSTLSIPTARIDQKYSMTKSSQLPKSLLHCLTLGVTSRNSRPVLESWVAFLGQCLPLYEDTIFQVMIPLVECLCNAIGSVFKSMQVTFEEVEDDTNEVLDNALALLLNGLEQSIAIGHERLLSEDVSSPVVKSPEQNQQSFFGNMVSGVFTSDVNRSKTMTTNNRLTVLLCFKDAVRICHVIWSWGDSGTGSLPQNSSTLASFNYVALRLRNRTRRMFEHFFRAEPLESLETLVEIWQRATNERDERRAITIINLLHVLDGSRPRNAIPALFNAVYSRTNPAALDPRRKSTLTSILTDTGLAAFLVAYTRALDDDTVDEIWNDCMTFLKDVLANPLPHRQILPRLLEFIAVLGDKVDRTNFGEQRRMRRELADLFVRLLTATITIRPVGFSSEVVVTSNLENYTTDSGNTRTSFEDRAATGSDGLVPVLATITPQLSKVLVDTDRMTSTTATISAQIIGPTFRSKLFPENITQQMLDLILALADIPEASRSWRRDVAEAFNDARFFANAPAFFNTGWLTIIQRWILSDKERMPELLSRIPSPTAAGIMFGVGATSARLEADRRTQLNLRRVSLLILAAAEDAFVVNLTGLQEKLVDLMNATTTSSPSSTTRAEVYMVIRALLLKVSMMHLSSFWPTINSELYSAISSALPPPSGDELNVLSLLQACKLLDVLLALGIDDFQMQEWLFITDTTDAVYRSADLSSVALVDKLAEGIDADGGASHPSILTSATTAERRHPILTWGLIKDVKREDLMEKILRPFFRQLSIHAFESTYSMKQGDRQICIDDLIMDLFNDSTLV